MSMYDSLFDPPEVQQKKLSSLFDSLPVNTTMPAPVTPPPERPGILGDIIPHFAIGANKYVSLPIAGAMQIAGDMTGIKPLSDAGNAMAENAMAYIADKERQSPTQRFQDIAGPGDVARWAVQQSTEMAPQIVTGMVAGGAGAAAGRGIAGRMIAGAAERAGLGETGAAAADALASKIAGKRLEGITADQIASTAAQHGISEGAAKSLLTRGAALGQASLRGAQAAQIIPAWNLESSTIYQGMKDGEKDPYRALTYGVLAALPDIVVPGYILEKTGAYKMLPGMRAFMEEHPLLGTGQELTLAQRAKDIGKTIATATAGGTGQEALQTTLERIGSREALQSDEARKNGFWKTVYDKGLRAAMDPDAWNDIVESSAAGGLMGGLEAVGGHGLGHLADVMQQKADGVLSNAVAPSPASTPVETAPAPGAATSSASGAVLNDVGSGERIPEFSPIAGDEGRNGSGPLPQHRPDVMRQKADGALTHGLQAAGIALPATQDHLPELRPVTPDYPRRGIAGPVIDADYAEIPRALPAPPTELEKAHAWARDQIANGNGMGLMRGYGVSDAAHDANILNRYRLDRGMGRVTEAITQGAGNAASQNIPAERGTENAANGMPEVRGLDGRQGNGMPVLRPANESARGRRRELNPAKDDLVVAMAKLGGLDLAQAKQQWGTTVSDDAKALNRHAGRAGGTGIAFAFKSDGVPLDSMREQLVEHGYLPEGSTVNDMADAIHAAARGNHTYSDQADIETRLDQAEQEWLSRQDLSRALDLNDDDLVEAGVPDLAPEEQGLVHECYQDIADVLLNLFNELEIESYGEVKQLITEVQHEVRNALTAYSDAQEAGPEGEAAAAGPETESGGSGEQAGGDHGEETGTIGEREIGIGEQEKTLPITSPESPVTDSDTQPRETAEVVPASEIDQAANEAATSPTNETPEPSQAQIEAGNYKKGHVDFQGLDISIENPAGSLRKGVDENGKAWETELQHHYGYIKGTIGRDKDHIDVFIGPDHESGKVYVVDQVDPKTGKFDEHKVMLGFDSPGFARSGYLANYDTSGPSRIGNITESSMDSFKQWLNGGDTRREFVKARNKARFQETREKFLQKKLAETREEKEKARLQGLLEKLQEERGKRSAKTEPVDEFDAAWDQVVAEREQAAKTIEQPKETPVKPAEDNAQEPYFKKGNRVQLDDGSHGEIVDSTTFKITKSLLGLSNRGLHAENRSDEYSHSYTVKKDNGVQVNAYFREMNHETGTAPHAVPAPVYEDKAMDPEMLRNRIKYELDRASNNRSAASRARKSDKIANLKKSAETADRTAQAMQKAYDDWAAKYPEEAAKYQPQTAQTTAPPKSESTGQERTPQNNIKMSLKETVHGKKGHNLYVVTMNERVDRDVYDRLNRDAKRTGNGYSAYRGRGAIPGFQFLDRRTAEEFMRKWSGSVPTSSTSAEANVDSYSWDALTRYGKQSVVKALGIKLLSWHYFTTEERQAINNYIEDHPEYLTTRPEYKIGDYVKVKPNSGWSESKSGRINHVFTDQYGKQRIKTENSGNVHMSEDDLEPAEAPSLASAATHAGNAFDAGVSAIKTILKNSANPDKLSSGIGPDDEVYQQIRPHLVTMWTEAKAAASDAKDALMDFIRRVIDAVGIEVKPYAKAFYNEVKSGIVDITVNENALEERGDELRGNVDDTAENREPARAETAEGSGDSGRSDAGSAAERSPGGRGHNSANDTRSASGSANYSENAGNEPGKVRGSGNRGKPDNGVLEVSPVNYRISGDDRLGKGGAKQKARDNITAIKLLKQITREERAATPEEQAKLVKYVGWGASELANNVFEQSGYHPVERKYVASWFKEGWENLGQDLKDLLTPEEYQAAKKSTLNSHYTSDAIIGSMYQALEKMGFTGGRMLEPGCGVGHFIGLLPDNLQSRTRFTGVELDNTSAAIAKLLYPDHDIRHQGFEKFTMPDGFYDAAIGNPPFADIEILSDPTYARNKFKLHDFFFAKAMDKVRPGGLLMFVTSRYTMDKINDAARSYLSERADLMGAIRLPQTAFKENAGTEVVTDVLFLRKRAAGEKQVGETWSGLKEISTPEGPVNINEYFADHPGMVLGSHSMTGSMYGGNEYTVLPDKNGSIADQFRRAAENLPRDIYRREKIDSPVDRNPIEFDLAPSNIKEGAFYADPKGNILSKENGIGTPLTKKGKDLEIVRSFIPLRDAVRQVLYVQIKGGDLQAAQKDLKTQYDNFVRQHGPINKEQKIVTTKNGTESVSTRYPNFSPFRDDPDAYLIASIEKYNPETGKATPGPIFTERTIKPEVIPQINSITDALHVVMHEDGRVDMSRIAAMMNVSEPQAMEALGDAVYHNPQTSAWETDDEYLSGNVKKKLTIAKSAALADPKYNRNVEALKAVQPEDLPPSRISLGLGEPIVDPKYVEQFAKEVIGLGIKVDHLKQTGDWSVQKVSGYATQETTSDWGTARRPAHELIDAALNSRQIRIETTIHEDGQDKKVFDKDATNAANEKLSKIKDRFGKWIWENPERSEELSRSFNDAYNNTVKRQYGGSHIEKMTFPGMSAIVNPFEHQKRVAWRVVQSGNTYMAHSVGAGKTIGSILAGMELKRLGIKKKPCWVVPNHMLKQFASEFLQLYPSAKIMVADEMQFSKENRNRFMGRVASENWDGVIITHSAFGKMQVSPEFSAQYIQDQLDELEWALNETDKGDRLKRKQIERAKARLEQRLEKVLSAASKDKGVTFEDTGIDQLFVDEAHEFRKLDFVTNQTNIKGIDPNGSLMAFDLYVKSRYLESLYPNRSLVLMSGTPITNTIGEIYTIQRFLQEEKLRELGLDNFDAWSNTFGDMSARLEATPAGNYRPVTRFAKFKKMSSLSQLWGEVGDFIHAKDLTYLKRPAVETGGRQIVTSEQSDAQKGYKRYLANRIKAIELRRRPPQKGDDILLSVITDGRHAALDERYVAPGMKPSDDNKLEKMVRNVSDIWEETKKDRLTQMIFCDLGMPGSETRRGFSAYNRIREALIGKGIPEKEIAFMQDYKKSDEKRKLFQAMNEGRIRILIGSSEAMGTGVNAQKKLVALHHLDPDTYLPSNIEQREGRIVRQGNDNDKVRIFAYVNRGSYDEAMWQFLETKQRFIDQFLAGETATDETEDIDGGADSFAMAKAMSSDNPLVLEKAGLESDIQRLESLSRAHFDDQMRLRRMAAMAEDRIPLHQKEIARIEKIIARRTDTAGDKFSMVLDSDLFDERKKAGENLLRSIGKMMTDGQETDWHKVGEVAGLDIMARSGISIKIPWVNLAVGANGVYSNPVSFQGLESTENTDPVGLAMKLENLARSFDRRLTDEQEYLRKDKKTVIDSKDRIGRPFEHAQALDDKRNRLNEIETILAAENKEESEPETAPEYSRAETISPTPAAEIKTALSSALEKSAVPIRILQSITDLPEHIQSDMQRWGIRAVDGVFDPRSGSMYLVSDYIPSVDRAKELLRHEWFHAGVADRELAALYKYYSQKDMARLETIAKERGFNLQTEYGRKQAAGELAAQLAETNPKNFYLNRIVAKIKEWLRALGFDVQFGQADVSQIIRQAIGRVTGEERMDGVRTLAGSAYSAAEKFVLSPDGNIDFGALQQMTGTNGVVYPSAPVRLEKGGDYGHQHIAEKRVKEFKDLGYANEIEALYDITTHYTDVYEQPNGRLLLVKRDARGKYASVELQKEGNYYGVTTWFLEDESPKSKTPYENRGGRKLLLHVAHADDSGQPSPFPVTGDKDQAGNSRRSDQNNSVNSTSLSGNKVNPQYSVAKQDAEIADHAAKIDAPGKVATMTKAAFEIAGQHIPPKLKASIGRFISNPWFGSEGKPVRRAIVNLNIQRSHTRNEIISDLFRASEGYQGVEGLHNILKNATTAELKQFNELIKYGDRNDIAKTFTRDELYRGKTPFGKLSKTVVEAYKTFNQVIQATNRVRFEKLGQIALLPYQKESWYQELLDLLDTRMQLDHGLNQGEVGQLNKLLSSLRRRMSDQELFSEDNPTKKPVSKAVAEAYKKFVDQLENTSEPHLIKMAYKNITEYRGKLDEIKNDWGHVQGYAPRMRKDGDWHVSVYRTGEDGERVKVYMKPTITEAGAQSEVGRIRKDLPKYLKSNYVEGTQYDVEYARDSGTPDELLSERGKELALEQLIMTAFDKAGVFKTSAEDLAAMKRAVLDEVGKEIMAQGFGRHGISREKTQIEGYRDDDYVAVLKDFISGMAGWLSKMQYAVEVNREAERISQGNPDDRVWVYNYFKDSMKNSNYLDEVAATARSLGALYYLGFKVSSAVLNSFQNYTVGQAILAGMMKKAGRKGEPILLLARAQKDMVGFAMGKNTLTDEEKQVLHQAVRQGTAHAQAVRYMSGLSEQGFDSKYKKFVEMGMTPFSWVEQYVNREPGVLAAYRAFKTTPPGRFDEAAFKTAEEFINSSHYLMGSENLPEMVRKTGALGKTLYLFQGYTHNYLLSMAKALKNGEFEVIARSFGAIAALGGVFALPGADDLDKWLTKWFGKSYKLQFKLWMRRNAKDYGSLGEAVEAFVNYGAPSVAGIDMSRAIGVNIPFVSDPDKSFGESMAGVWGGMVKKPVMAAQALGSGQYYRAIESMMPEFVANPMRAYRQATTGATTLSGKPILDETGHQMQYSGLDVAKKILGFNPTDISARTELKSTERDLTANWSEERKDRLTALRVAVTPEEVRKAVKDVRNWNISLRQSQAWGLVNPISAASIQRAHDFRVGKVDRRKMVWERGFLQ